MNQIFKIGDEVIALSSSPTNSINQKRIKGNKYIVNIVEYCAKCGVQSINLGQKMDLSKYHDVSKCGCGHLQPNNGYHFTNSIHFIKPQELQATLEQAVKEENFELACTLRDINL